MNLINFKLDIANCSINAQSQWKKWKAETSYYEFVKQAFSNVPAVSKGQSYRDNWHLKIICDAIQEKIKAIHDKKPVKDLIINVPPGTMKSIMVSKCLVPWVWTWWPEFCYLIASYSADLAGGNCRVAQDVIKSDWYQSNWGDKFELKKDTTTFLINTMGGHCYSVGIGGSVTGNHYHAHSYDDLIDPEMAKSDAERMTALRVMDTTLINRFVSLDCCLRIVTQQRLHELDPTGHILQQVGADNVDIYSLPVSTEFAVLPKELESKYTKINGEPHAYLWPGHIGPDAMKRIRPSMTIAGFNSQYGQSPSPDEGEVIKKWYWQFYDPQQESIDRDSVNFYADTAFGKEAIKNKNEGKTDYSVCFATVKHKGNLYLLDRIKDRDTSPIWRKNLIRFVLANGNPDSCRVYIEPKANGQAQIDEIRQNGITIEETTYNLALPEMTISESMLNVGKEVRLDSQLSKIEGRRVFLPIGPHEYTFKDSNGDERTVKVAEWVPDFIETCAKFPNGAHDDDIDPLVYALMYELRQSMFI